MSLYQTLGRQSPATAQLGPADCGFVYRLTCPMSRVDQLNMKSSLDQVRVVRFTIFGLALVKAALVCWILPRKSLTAPVWSATRMLNVRVPVSLIVSFPAAGT